MKFRNDQERQVWGMVYAAMLSRFFADPDLTSKQSDEYALSWADGAVEEMRDREPVPTEPAVKP